MSKWSMMSTVAHALLSDKTSTVLKLMGGHHHTTTTTVLRPFFGTIRMSQCWKRTSGLYGARED